MWLLFAAHGKYTLLLRDVWSNKGVTANPLFQQGEYLCDTNLVHESNN